LRRLHSFRFVFGSWVLYGSGHGSFGAQKQRTVDAS
jgi:hypothetical protein